MVAIAHACGFGMRGVDSSTDADVRKRREKGSASNDANETPVRSRAKSPGTMSVPSANAPEALGKRCMGATGEREKTMSAIAFHDDRSREFRPVCKKLSYAKFLCKNEFQWDQIGGLHREQSCRVCPSEQFRNEGPVPQLFWWGAKVE